MREIVPRETLVKQGMRGFGGVGGGVGLLVLQSLARIGGGFSLPGLIVGGGLTLFGLGVAAKDPTDRDAGLVTAAAGIMTGVASLPIVGGLASGLMWISGVGLLAIGGYNLYRFFRGIKARS
ncbi:MAG: hypothetical protein EA384_09315 [Spirochaetaceae bacterium]|nr:MAG: hypothetical protein EA384_09315 [Spirochaetaceae bacterium]